MSDEKELSPADVEKLMALSERWWEAEQEATIRLNWVIERQEEIETEILDIVLGLRE